MMNTELIQTANGHEIYAEAETGNKQWVAVITDTHPKYNFERKFAAYQKPKTTKRDSGRAALEEGDVVEMVRYTHSGKNDTRHYYQFAGSDLHEIDEADITRALDEVIVEVAPEPADVEFDGDPAVTECHECEECGREFDSAHGVAVHAGMTHGDDEDESEATADADEGTTQAVAADGGVDVDAYDIDPTELDYDIVNTTRDNTNSRSNYLARIDGTDIWVAYRTWQTGPSEYASAIKGIGRLNIEAADIDTETIAESIREEMDRADTSDDLPDEYLELVDELHSRADELAERLAEQWEYGVGEVVGDSIYDGVAGVDGTNVWVSHVEEAFVPETKWSLDDMDIEDDDGATAYDTAMRALYDAVGKHRNHYMMPHAEYVGVVRFDDVDPWELRALELEHNSVLKNKTELCRVAALVEEGHRQYEIAEKLGKAESTVSRQRSQIEEWTERAKWTVKNNVNESR